MLPNLWYKNVTIVYYKYLIFFEKSFSDYKIITIWKFLQNFYFNKLMNFLYLQENGRFVFPLHLDMAPYCEQVSDIVFLSFPLNDNKKLLLF